MANKRLLKLLVGVGVFSFTLAGCNQGGQEPKDERRHIYELATEAGYKGTYEEWLESIRGQDGANGKDGVSVVKVEKTSTDGLVDTYTITYSNNTTSTFTITNGKDGDKGENGVSVVSVEKTKTEGLIDTYTITLSNGETYSFTIKNGEQGQQGEPGKSAYQTYVQYNPEFMATEAEWINGLAKGFLTTEIDVTYLDTEGNPVIQYAETFGERIKKHNIIKDGMEYYNFYYKKDGEEIEWDFSKDYSLTDLTLYAKNSRKVKVMESYSIEDKYFGVPYNYDDTYFQNSAENYSKNLAMLSAAATTIYVDNKEATDFYSGLGFDNIVPTGYEVPSSKDTTVFTLAHKKIADDDLIAVSIRSFEYFKEWANNFTIGTEGDAVGFSSAATIIYNALKEYISTNYSSATRLKLWVAGYSRGGALANVLAYKVFSGQEINVTSENFFVYAFETPRALCKEHAEAYPFNNVFNILSSADPITYFAPVEYGLYRCGKEIDIYDSEASRILANLDEDFVLSDFIVYEGMPQNDAEFAQYLIQVLETKTTTEEIMDISTRENYAYYQEYIAYLLELYFGLTKEQSKAFIKMIKDKASEGMMTIVMEILVDAGYTLIKTFLDEQSIPYDADKLQNALTKVVGELIVGVLLAPVAPIVLDEETRNVLLNNAMRCIKFHYPEVSFSLLENYNSKH